jgi:hypothetical protein
MCLSSTLRWDFLGLAAFFPFESRFFPAGIVFEGRESASYKDFLFLN